MQSLSKGDVSEEPIYEIPEINLDDFEEYN